MRIDFTCFDNVKLAEAFEITAPNKIDCYVPAEVPLFEFSHSFELKMQELIRKQKRSHFRVFTNAVKRGVCVAAAVVLVSLSGLGVIAVRDPEESFYMKKYPTYTLVGVASDDDFVAEPFETVYELKGIPEGFELVYSVDQPVINVKGYENGDKFIWFYQDYKYGIRMNLDNEHSDILMKTDENGKEYLLHVSYKDRTKAELRSCGIYWIEGDYLFNIYSNIDRESLMDLYISPK